MAAAVALLANGWCDVARIGVSGWQEKIALSPVEEEGACSLSPLRTGPEAERNLTLTGSVRLKRTGQPETVRFVFRAARDGEVKISLRGPSKGERGFLRILRVSSSGTEFANPDFLERGTNALPAGWRITGTPFFRDGRFELAGQSSCFQMVRVKKDMPVRVEFSVQLVEKAPDSALVRPGGAGGKAAAGCDARIGVSGWRDKITLAPENSGSSCPLAPLRTGPEAERNLTLTGRIRLKGTGRPETVRFAFRAAADGEVKISLRGPSDGARGSVRILKVTASGTEFVNPEFRESAANGLPAGWRITGAPYLREGLLELSGQSSCFQMVRVRKDVPVEVEFLVLVVKPERSASLRVTDIPGWSFEVMRENGEIRDLRCRDRLLFRRMSRTLQTDRGKVGEFRLLGVKTDPVKRSCRLSFLSERWLLEELLTFSGTGGLERSARLFSLIPQPQAFYHLEWNYELAGQTNFLIPVTLFGDTRDIRVVEFQPNAEDFVRSEAYRTGSLAALKPGESRQVQKWTGCLAVYGREGTLLFLNDDRREPMTLAVERDAKEAKWQVRQTVRATGWALPEQVQTIGGAHLRISADPPEQAIERIPKQWHAAIGFSACGEKSDLTARASVYEVNPYFYRGTGGFRQLVARGHLARIRSLGFDTLWLMPVNSGAYTPVDSFTIAPELGSGEELREFIRAAHAEGFRVLADIVPHGGVPDSAAVRGESILSLRFGRRGEAGSYARGYFCSDYKSKEHQAYIGRLCEWYLKEFGFDGFRLDSAEGCSANWRREGFPFADRIPANLSEEWFRREIDRLPGKQFPALEYERGSFASREGGMEMVRVLQQALKRFGPENGWVLAEVADSMYMQAGDAVYDFFFRLCVFKLPGMRPEEFAAGLARRMREQLAVDPAGTRRLRYAENHDGVDLYPFLGIGAGRALAGSVFLMPGIPLVYQRGDVGNGLFFRRLNELRAARPELRGGDADYRAVRTSDPALFCVLRRSGAEMSVGVINFSATSREAVLTLPEDFPAGEVRDLLAARTVRRNGQRLSVRLKPWDTALYAVAEPLPEPSSPASPPPADRPVLREEPDRIVVANNRYTLSIDRAGGALEHFAASGGETLLGRSDLLFSKPPENAPAEVFVERRKSGEISILARRNLGGTGRSIRYVCGPEKVRVESSLPAGTPDAVSALLLASPSAVRYQVCTMEGVLDDFITPVEPFSSRLPAVPELYHRGYRNRGKTFCWESDSFPLDPVEPVIRYFLESGRGVEIRILSPYGTPPVETALLEMPEFASTPVCALYHSLPGRQAERFQFELRPLAGTEPAPAGFGRVEQGGVSLRSGDGGNWVVENDTLRIVLSRIGGVIREVVSKKDGRILLRDQEVLSRNWVSTRKNPLRTIYDPGASISVRQTAAGLHVKFRSIFQGEHRFDYPWRNLWCETEYLFPSSEGFRTRWNIVAEELPVTEKPEAFCRLKTASRNMLRADAAGGTDTADGWTLPILPAGVPVLPGRFFRGGFAFSATGNFAGVPELPAPADYRGIPDGSFELAGARLLDGNKPVTHQNPADIPGICRGFSSRDICYDRSDASDGAVSLLLKEKQSVRLFQLKPELTPGTYLLRIDCRNSVGKSFRLHCGLDGATPEGRPAGAAIPTRQCAASDGWNTQSISFRVKERMIAPILRISWSGGAPGSELRLDRVEIAGEESDR